GGRGGDLEGEMDRRRRHGDDRGRKNHRELTPGAPFCAADNENNGWEDLMTRGGILAGVGAIALLAGAAVLAGGPIASAQSKKEVPLDTKGDASERPRKRYAGWPTRDESK